jgi:DNA integrity scanning protein DisA with diadenylate cyclase activity
MSELADDGILIGADDDLLPVLLDELDYARRPQPFEGRTPLYGSMIVPPDRSLIEAGELVDLVPLDGLPLDVARRFSDGRSVYLAVSPDGTRVLACFRRSVQYEADMVEIQTDTGAYIVQRTPVLGVTRMFMPTQTIEWSGYRWTSRPNARAQHDLLRPFLPQVRSPVMAGLLDLAIHWLSPGRIGATLVVPVSHGDSGLELTEAVTTPDLSITARHHYPALLAALMQSDLATVVDETGRPDRIGVGLRWTPEAEQAVEVSGGMRHRSAARYTYDHPEAVAVVVSEDGPVTVFARGKPVSRCAGSLALTSASEAS